jgi:hypothetical protein
MSPADDPLEPLFERRPHLEDDGFTARILQRLPARRRRWRPLVLGSAFGLALALATLLDAELLAVLSRLWDGAAVAAAASALSGVVPLTLFAAAVGVAVKVTLLRDQAS